MADTPANNPETGTAATGDTTQQQKPVDQQQQQKPVDQQQQQQTTTETNTDLKSPLNTDDTKQAPPSKFPETWREELAGTDTGLLNILKRYGSPQAFSAAHRQLVTKMSDGSLKSASPPEGATAEDIAAWRKQNGVPEKAADYVATLPKGLVVGEADKPLMDAFFADMHAKNAPPDMVNTAVEWYYKNTAQFLDQRRTLDDKARSETEDAMHGEWGDGYRKNVNIIANYMQATGTYDLLINSRAADGRPIASTAEFLRFMLQSAMDNNPAATLVPGLGTGAMTNLVERKAELQKMMGNRQSDYWKRGDVGQKLQEEYRNLIDAEMDLNRKNGKR